MRKLFYGLLIGLMALSAEVNAAGCAKQSWCPKNGARVGGNVCRFCPENSSVVGPICECNAGYERVGSNGSWISIPNCNMNKKDCSPRDTKNFEVVQLLFQSCAKQ